ncbi:AIM5 (YBR262C) [Zygosaccharomyces parabailii]|nr:AIM5 (YBR262C) [Zygosaccharomyces parabailii]
MSKLVKLTSITVVSSALAASYYYYFVDRDGFYYNNSQWRRVGSKVQGIIDGSEDIKPSTPCSTKSVTIVTRPMSETMKDLWNEQIRNTADWIYSWGKQ